MTAVIQCGACEAPATLVCGGCGDISYCRKECQKSHWKKGHKSSCKAYKIEIHPEQAQYIHLDSKLLVPVVWFAELVKTGCCIQGQLQIWAEHSHTDL